MKPIFSRTGCSDCETVKIHIMWKTSLWIGRLYCFFTFSYQIMQFIMRADFHLIKIGYSRVVLFDLRDIFLMQKNLYL